MSKKNKINQQTRLGLTKRIWELERENEELVNSVVDKEGKISCLEKSIISLLRENSKNAEENSKLRSRIFKNNIFLGFAGFFSLVSLVSRFFRG